MHPLEQQHETDQPPETGRHEAGQDDQQQQARQALQDLGHTLEAEVQPTAEVALQRARDDADQGAAGGHDQAEQHRGAEAVDHPRQHVARLAVGAEQVMAGGRPRGRRLGVPVDGVVVEPDRRPQHPAMALTHQRLHRRVAILRRGLELAAERRLGIGPEHRRVEAALKGHQDRLVVGDELGEQRQREQGDEDPQADVAAPIVPEAAPAALGQRRDPHTQDLRRCGDDPIGDDGVHLRPPGARSRSGDRRGCRSRRGSG